MAVVVWWFYKSKSPWTCCHTWDHVNKQPETTLMKPTEHPAMCDSSLFKCKHAAHHTLLALQGQSDESVINDSGNNFRHRGLTKCFWKMLKRFKKNVRQMPSLRLFLQTNSQAYFQLVFSRVGSFSNSPGSQKPSHNHPHHPSYQRPQESWTISAQWEGT